MRITASQVFTNGPVKCPNCRIPGQAHPGYLVKGRKVTRCETCKGIGHCTMTRAMDHEAGLA